MGWLYLGIMIAFILYDTVRLVAIRPFSHQVLSEVEIPVNPPLVSFLVPAWNASHDIVDFVATFRSLTYPRKELILCAGGTDLSYEIAETLSGSDVIILRQETGEGKQRALARSYAKATGEIIYLSDIDCRLTDAVVQELLQPLLIGSAEVVTGTSRPLDSQLDNAFVMAQWAVQQATDPDVPCEVAGILGRNAALTRDAVEASGRFETPAPSGTDYTLAKEVIRSNRRILMVPQSSMPTEFPDHVLIYAHKQGRWIANVIRLGWRYRAWGEVRNASITVIIPMALLLLVVLGFVWSELWVIDGLLIVQALFNRMRYQRRAAMSLQVWATLTHFFADQWAASRAGMMVVSGQWRW